MSPSMSGHLGVSRIAWTDRLADSPGLSAQVVLQLSQRRIARVRNAAVYEFGDPRVADVSVVGYARPISAPAAQPCTHLFVEVIAHASKIATLCYLSKQHIASKLLNTCKMDTSPINAVLASNLRYYMETRNLTQKALGERAGMAQTTIGFYLSPERRKPSKSGKTPSANLGDVQKLATGLGVQVWELLRPLTPNERVAYEQIEKAFRSLQSGDIPAPAPLAEGASVREANQ